MVPNSSVLAQRCLTTVCYVQRLASQSQFRQGLANNGDSSQSSWNPTPFQPLDGTCPPKVRCTMSDGATSVPLKPLTMRPTPPLEPATPLTRKLRVPYPPFNQTGMNPSLFTYHLISCVIETLTRQADVYQSCARNPHL